MLTPARVLIASPDVLMLERILGYDAGFSVLAISERGDQALADMQALETELLILDEVLPVLDGPAILKHIAPMPAPPRVLYLSRTGGDGREADESIPYPCAPETLLAAAHRVNSMPLPALAQTRAAERRALSGKLLDELGVPARLKGRRYMLSAIAAGACAPRMLSALGESMYPYVAAQFGATAAAVEKAIRTAVESTWLHGDLSAIQALFGFSVDPDKGKPTNAEFLAMLALHVRKEMARSQQ